MIPNKSLKHETPHCSAMVVDSKLKKAAFPLSYTNQQLLGTHTHACGFFSHTTLGTHLIGERGTARLQSAWVGERATESALGEQD